MRADADPEVERLVALGEIEAAAQLAKHKRRWVRAAQLYASLGRASEAALAAVEADAWRLAFELALSGGDDAVLDTLIEAASRDAGRATAAAAACKLERRDDLAARLLETVAPDEAAQLWYARGEYLKAARVFDVAGQQGRAIRAFEQHLEQHPDDPSPAERLAELRALQGDVEGAVRALQWAVRGGAGEEAIARLIGGLHRMGLDTAARRWVSTLRRKSTAFPAELEAYAARLPIAREATTRYAGRYRVVREVGSGSTGRVLEAVDELSGDTVALKVLTVSDDRSAAFGRFMREAELARAIDDPTLVRMRDLDPEGPTIVYDWMPGGTLTERIGQLTLPEIRQIMTRLLTALETLHRNGVVHRDIKPSNVLFDPAGQCRLGDLGAAHLGDLGATVTGGLVGSLPYMAPEQVTGGAVQASTDFYALGVMFFQMLTASLPYNGPDFVAQHLSEPVPSAAARVEGLPHAFDEVLASLLAKDADARPLDAPTLRVRLNALPWGAEVELPQGVRVSRVPSLPGAAGGEEGERLVPSQASPDLWTDTLLQREIERLKVAREARSFVTAWSSAGSSLLQAVFDLFEDGADDVWWLDPMAASRIDVATLPRATQSGLLEALRGLGLDLASLDGLRPAWRAEHAEATLGLGAVLALRGVRVERL
ncbi:MAG: protein kinase [Myxococcales bacterium]|nr:protein kinase [Myxococcales bacterium]